MKKVFVIIICLVFMTVLTGCGEAKIYKEATAAFEAGDYIQAIALLDTIPEYADEDNIRAQSDEILAYEKAVLDFQDALEFVTNENAEIDALCESGQTLLNSDKLPYDETTSTNLQVAISTLKNMKKVVEDMPESTADILSAVEIMNKPVDYSEALINIKDAQTALEASIKQMEQITNPTGDFVITRLSQIDGIGDIQGVTEDYDPNGQLNKQGGYTSSTYFSSLLINQAAVSGADVVAKGTECGGCIEVFPTSEDAEKRNSYLSAFDGMGMLASGSHVVLGSIVIRTSNRLTATQQQELTSAIISKLLELK